MSFREYLDEDRAIELLAQRLIDGSLVLFLGAGASRGFGLPTWIEYANLFRKEVGLLPDIPDSANTDEIQDGLDLALDQISNDDKEKIRITTKILYEDSKPLTAMSALSSHLLIAISSLLIGRKRGHIRKVVTFNYDSMLEWFLSLYGFQTKSITDLPALEGSEDVRIYHPHGYAPHPSLAEERPSKRLIVGLEDANLRAAGDDWWSKEREILESGLGLFIGLSTNAFSDRAFQPHFALVKQKLNSVRPLGVWICKGKGDEGLIAKYLRYDVIPIFIEDGAKIPEFVLSVSQRALEKLTKND